MYYNNVVYKYTITKYCTRFTTSRLRTRENAFSNIRTEDLRWST